MSQASDLSKRYSFEEYTNLEAASQHRYEYYFGEIFGIGTSDVANMAGGTKQHNRLVKNVGTLLDGLLEKGCESYNENVKLEVVPGGYYVYPDVILTCDPRDMEDNLLVKYPSLIVEVLSESTQSHDLGTKLENYLRLPSLQAYLILHQHKMMAQCYERTNDFWKYSLLEGAETLVAIPALSIEWSLSEIYAHVRFAK
ncbi:MAG: Uma2 family endonuclease [Bacteroidota bacterium]